MTDQNMPIDFNEHMEKLVVTQARKLLNQNNYTKSILSTLPIALIATDKQGNVLSFNNTASQLLDLKNSKKLTTCFAEDSSLQQKIESCLNNEEKYTINSQKITTKNKEENVVNIYIQPLYDDEKIICGIILALEDQTYISFLQESILRYTSLRNDSQIISVATLTKKLLQKIKTSSKSKDTVLITGDSGTGKTFFARKLHKEYGFSPNDPFIVIECKEIIENDPRKFLFGNINNNQETDGEIAFRSVNDYGVIHLAHGGTLVLKNVDKLPLNAQESLYNFLNQEKTNFLKDLNVRIIHISSGNVLESLEGILYEDLSLHLKDKIITIPTLWERRKEIILLANLFLKESENGAHKTFSLDAENELLSRRYSYNNVKELKEAVELSAEVSEDNEISSECIFIGPKEEESLLELNLSQYSWVKWLIKDKVLRNIRLLILAVFLAISGLAIVYSDSKIGSVVNVLMWGLWWPGMILFLIIGRLWCSICPLSTAASFVKKYFTLNIKPPLWIKKSTYFIIPLGFIIIITVEHVFHMNVNPMASGIFLLSLILIAVIFSVLYERETWCRYICPLGGLGAIYSVGAIVNVKANPDVCSTKCKTHECFKGSDTQLGCPVFHHPLYAKESHVCKLCFNCIKSCPNNSAKITLQFPLMRIWKQKEMPDALSVFAYSVFFMSPILLGFNIFIKKPIDNLFIIAAASVFVLSFFISWVLSKSENKAGNKNGFTFTRISLAFMVLAWGPLAAFQFGNIPILNSIIIQSSVDGIWNNLFSSSGVSFIKILQSTAVIVSAIFGWITILGIKKQIENNSKNIFRLCSVIFILYVFLNIFLIYSN